MLNCNVGETISFEEETAKAQGWSLRWWDFLFYCLFGMVITFSVPLGGVLLVFSFLVVPAVTAFLFTREPKQLTIIAFSTGALASAIGLWLSYNRDLPTGPTIDVLGTPDAEKSAATTGADQGAEREARWAR